MTRDLRPFFAPASVAVVGAGERATSSGGAVLQNLKIAGFPGAVYPINPKGGSAFGYPVYRSLAELPAPAELAVIVIRPDLIPQAVRDAAETGHRHLLILPGGFVEAGADGAARDREVREIAEPAGITIAGPNCAGIIHLRAAARFGATFLRAYPPGGGIALISQSGALAEEVIAAANRSALPFGTVVSVGNGMHLGSEDYLDYLGGEPDCTAVLLYVESIDDPTRFRRIARRVAQHKPVVMLMGGRSAAGAAAATAHTGAVPNSDAAMTAFAEECGVLRVDSLRRLLLAAKGFGRYPQGIGPRVLILSNSGGPGVLAADRAAAEGLHLPPLPAAMARTLRAALPAEAAVGNPIDLLADAREDRFGLALDSALRDGAGSFDAVLGVHVVPFMVEAGPVVDRLAATAAAGPALPFLHSMMGTLPERAPWFAALEQAGVPMFDDAEAMAECAGLLADYPRLRALAARPEPAGPPALKGRGQI